MDCIVHEILQARILEWVAFHFSRGSSQPRDETHDQPRQHIKKQKHYFANKGLSSQSYGFSSSHGRRQGWDVLREQHQNMYIIQGETDHQPRLDA